MKDSKDIELRIRVLLVTYKAMLGMISPNIRMVSIDWSENYYALKAYFDRPVEENDLDILKAITAEVAAHFPQMNDIRELAEYSNDSIAKIKGLKEMVFLRYGELSL